MDRAAVRDIILRSVVEHPAAVARLGFDGDFLIQAHDEQPGTTVVMEIETTTTRTLKEVFDHYATARDDYAFSRTHAVVTLAEKEGDKLISRSQARRVLARLDRFREVVLDFRRVNGIGPAFADEIFRVFRREHPAVRLTVGNASEDVSRMIRRAEAHE